MLLLSKKKVKDNGSFESLVIPLLDKLYSAALRLTRSEPDAEDLVQETILRTLDAFPRLDKSGNFAAYMFRTMTNIFINQYRHNKVVDRVLEISMRHELDECAFSSTCIAIWSDPDVRFEHTNISRILESAVFTLPERFRLVLIMADVMDFSYAEISQELSIPVGTVMSRLFRARAFVKKRLLERHYQMEYKKTSSANRS